MAQLGADRDHGACAGCGDVVGLHEPAWIELEDGTLHPSSLPSLDPDSHQRPRRIWRLGRLIDDFPPAS